MHVRRWVHAQVLRLPRSLVLDSRLVGVLLAGVLLAEALRAGDIHVACPAHLAFLSAGVERAEDLVTRQKEKGYFSGGILDQAEVAPRGGRTFKITNFSRGGV